MIETGSISKSFKLIVDFAVVDDIPSTHFRSKKQWGA